MNCAIDEPDRSNNRKKTEELFNKMLLTKSYNIKDDLILKKIISQIVDIANPDKIILFGSRAMGTQKEDSDYDICVLKKNIKKRRRFAHKIRSGIKIVAPIDIVVSTPAKFNALKQKWYFVYYDIEKTGRTLYEK